MSNLCEVCGAGYYLLSGYCDHCNSIQAGSEPHRLNLEIQDLQSRLTVAEARIKELEKHEQRMNWVLKNPTLFFYKTRTIEDVDDRLRAELDNLKETK